MYVGCCDVTAPALFACSQLPAYRWHIFYKKKRRIRISMVSLNVFTNNGPGDQSERCAFSDTVTDVKLSSVSHYIDDVNLVRL